MKFLHFTIKVFFKLILSYQVCVVQHAQITQNNKFRGIQCLCYHEMTKIQTPPPPLLQLLDFATPYCEGSELYVKHSPPPITKIVNGVVFLFHNHQLESVLINVRKKCSPDLKVSHVSLDTILQLQPQVQIRTYKYQKKCLKQLETMLLPILSKFKTID